MICPNCKHLVFSLLFFCVDCFERIIDRSSELHDIHPKQKARLRVLACERLLWNFLDDDASSEYYATDGSELGLGHVEMLFYSANYIRMLEYWNISRKLYLLRLECWNTGILDTN